MSREEKRRYDALLQEVRSMQKDSTVKGFGLERSDIIAICMGVIVAVVLYLEPQKTPVVAVVCLLALAVCLGFLLFHWCSHWRWIETATPTGRKVRLTVIGILASTGVVAYGHHSWPRRDPIEGKLDELLNSRAYSPEKLRLTYPFGYFVFELNYDNAKNKSHISKSVVGDLELDWTNVGFTKNTATEYEIRLPEAKLKDGRTALFGDPRIGGSKIVDGYSNGYFTNDIMVLGQILNISDTGIVFVVGFRPAPKFPRH